MFCVGDIVEVVDSVEEVLKGVHGKVVHVRGATYCVQFDDSKLAKYYNWGDGRGFADLCLRLVEQSCCVDREEFLSIIMC